MLIEEVERGLGGDYGRVREWEKEEGEYMQIIKWGLGAENNSVFLSFNHSTHG
jgi:hypothetical protein